MTNLGLIAEGPQHDAASKLFFVNLGGYAPLEIGELHKNVLIVRLTPRPQKQRALAQIDDWDQPHKDRTFEIERAVDVTSLMETYGCILTLKAATKHKPFAFECRYLPIG
jgi:hypothetical protein